MFLLKAGVLLLGSYLSLYVCYSLFLIAVNIAVRQSRNHKLNDEIRFLILIPAHNEELLIKRILASFKTQSYPQKLFTVLVVADNCVDKTLEYASKAGVEVLERKSSKNFGKGYAIKYALDNMSQMTYDAVLIIDADSIIGKDSLSALNRHIQQGAKALQCNNALANPEDSWFTLIMNVARTLGNDIIEPAKEKLGLSSHLMGNGMCFTKEIIEKYGWNAFSVGEDWEYYAKIINHGERIAFAQDVHVYHQESTSLKQATPQRMRWSSGRFDILRKYGFGLFGKGLIEKNFLKFDASLPLIFPNPSLAMNFTCLGILPSIILLVYGGSVIWIGWFGLLIILQMLFFITAVFYTKNKFKSFMSIFIAPLFLAWKMSIDILSFFGKGRKKWVRTKRHL